MFDVNNSESNEALRAGWNLEQSYSQLPSLFFSTARPEPASHPELVVFNETLAENLGLSVALLGGPQGAQVFTGNHLPYGAAPIAQAYAGHQFGNFVILGDGRAHLLGEQKAPDGSRWDIAFKGSGKTPYSRRGDGKAALGPMLREYLISEAMHFLGIPSTRSLAVAKTGEWIRRDSILEGAVLTRVASSHIRVGTFELALAHQDTASLRALLSYSVQRHYPDIPDTKERPLLFLDRVCRAQARLVAQWMLVGFIHGVMNTDNMSISGETIDYGPCAFMNRFDPHTVFSSIDRQGRYAYGNQSSIALWNLTRLAECLLPLVTSDHSSEAQAIGLLQERLSVFSESFEELYLKGMGQKLGWKSTEAKDVQSIKELLSWMEKSKVDYSLFFRQLADAEARESLQKDPTISAWLDQWKIRLHKDQSLQDAQNQILQTNPVVIPRNHEVELALERATQKADFSEFFELLKAVRNPFQMPEGPHRYGMPPDIEDPNYRTFCGT